MTTTTTELLKQSRILIADNPLEAIGLGVDTLEEAIDELRTYEISPEDLLCVEDLADQLQAQLERLRSLGSLIVEETIRSTLTIPKELAPLHNAVCDYLAQQGGLSLPVATFINKTFGQGIAFLKLPDDQFNKVCNGLYHLPYLQRNHSATHFTFAVVGDVVPEDYEIAA